MDGCTCVAPIKLQALLRCLEINFAPNFKHNFLHPCLFLEPLKVAVSMDTTSKLQLLLGGQQTVLDAKSWETVLFWILTGNEEERHFFETDPVIH